MSEREVRDLVTAPTESLAVEMKDWIDLSSAAGKEKLLKACLALRNHNGGYLLIGFDNATGAPNISGAPQDVRNSFHADTIQALVARHASEPFEVHVHFPQIEGQDFPVLEIDEGVQTPVAVKRPLMDGVNELVEIDTVYVRSLRSNNTPSTTKATWGDWAALVGRCFENREADIGRFLRRHLGDRGPEVERVFQAAAEDPALRVLRYGHERMESVAERIGEIPSELGGWEVGVAVVPELPDRVADESFLNLITSANPRYTGWPVWIDSRGFPDPESRPRTFEDGYEVFVPHLHGDDLADKDFWRIEPRGRFYLHRALQDDLRDGPRAPEPGTQLDFRLVIARAGEAIATALAFARALDAPEDAGLRFAFRWYGLEGRRLTAWSDPERYLSRRYEALQDEATTHVAVPSDTPVSAVGQYVVAATARLFAAFDGAPIAASVVEDLVREHLRG
ncbi:MAG: helix-turn-helix domain-containing protein [Rubrobacteraceae bacterium]